MQYTEVDFLVMPPEPWRDLLLVELMDLGYEGFEETPHGLKAYVASGQFDQLAVDRMLVMRDPHVTITCTVRVVPDINWNARWEQDFQPVEVDGQVLVRAEFHPRREGYRHEIVITPRMAFGTGHHATTRMMMRSMLGLSWAGQVVCDLGCGTGVLAILAEQLGASKVLAIDIDPVAVENARHNVDLNDCQLVTVEKGGTQLEQGGGYGTILANIERNTLVKAMPDLAGALAEGGSLLLSGFVVGDKHLMAVAAEQQGLELAEEQEEGEWAFQRWVKHIAR
ncbi:MAG TPA: 50S ribosomal protein L11 methyltransferase [Flavobacteriales bacterium]|nr:50S ribosomal protein L11 methyltransferase [Flavobacteriales bacterium]